MKRHSSFRIISVFMIVTLLAQALWPTASFAQSVLNLPAPGTMVSMSAAQVPVLMRGMEIHPDNPLLFDFIIDSGKSGYSLEGAEFRAESQKLIKYFLASLTVKENDQWVNLSPFEHDRMIPQELGKTELGRDMLAQDYILKQLTASLIYPEKDLGREFWTRVYARVREQYGAAGAEIPVDTFNKVWISADKARVLEQGNAAYVVGAHLKVMLETDYLATTNNAMPTRGHDAPLADTNERGFVSPRRLPTPQPTNVKATQVSTQTPNATNETNAPNNIAKNVLREIVIPMIEQEVNEGSNFAPLRQMFYSMILATWYKTTLKNSLLNQVYSNQDKTAGVLADDPAIKEKIYEQYLQAYKRGVFNYIKEEADPDSAVESAGLGESGSIARKYFSGGLVNCLGIPDVLAHSQSKAPGDSSEAQGNAVRLLVRLFTLGNGTMSAERFNKYLLLQETGMSLYAYDQERYNKDARQQGYNVPEMSWEGYYNSLHARKAGDDLARVFQAAEVNLFTNYTLKQRIAILDMTLKFLKAYLDESEPFGLALLKSRLAVVSNGGYSVKGNAELIDLTASFLTGPLFEAFTVLTRIQFRQTAQEQVRDSFRKCVEQIFSGLYGEQASARVFMGSLGLAGRLKAAVRFLIGGPDASMTISGRKRFFSLMCAVLVLNQIYKAPQDLPAGEERVSRMAIPAANGAQIFLSKRVSQQISLSIDLPGTPAAPERLDIKIRENNAGFMQVTNSPGWSLSRSDVVTGQEASAYDVMSVVYKSEPPGFERMFLIINPKGVPFPSPRARVFEVTVPGQAAASSGASDDAILKEAEAVRWLLNTLGGLSGQNQARVAAIVAALVKKARPTGVITKEGDFSMSLEADKWLKVIQRTPVEKWTTTVYEHAELLPEGERDSFISNMLDLRTNPQLAESALRSVTLKPMAAESQLIAVNRAVIEINKIVEEEERRRAISTSPQAVAYRTTILNNGLLFMVCFAGFLASFGDGLLTQFFHAIVGGLAVSGFVSMWVARYDLGKLNSISDNDDIQAKAIDFLNKREPNDLVYARSMAEARALLTRELLAWSKAKLDLDGDARVDNVNNMFVWIKFTDQGDGSFRLSFGDAAANDPAAGVTPGGIALDARKMELAVDKAAGSGISMSFDPAMVAEFRRGNFTGVEGLIIGIVPMPSLLPAQK
ncbi:MAG: hypothetical protein HQL20_08690 [Candidatus Omnitrophica bacterium]|nr:hypothetical protein [Candidatus Omnitrophota bacterium]